MYVAPEIIEIGTVREVTLGGADDGVFTDTSSPANGPNSKLTFS
jgi:hypothetical protein